MIVYLNIENVCYENESGKIMGRRDIFVLYEGRQEELRRIEMMMLEKKRRKFIVESKLFFVFEMKWNFVLLVRKLYGIGFRMNF